jgi:TonB family protein
MPSKNTLGLGALFAALILARAQDVTPPAPIHQVEPEWGAELSKGYLEDRTQVEMIMALPQWRFRPGKKDGHAAAFSVSIKVPVRRAIDPDIERSFGLHRFVLSREADAIKAGAEMDAAGAAQVQQSLAVDPKNINLRTTLLAYYANAKMPNKEELRKARLEQIAWLVQNAPESHLMTSPLSQINAQGDPLPDPSGYAQVRELWLQQVSSNPDNAGILAGAADFLKIADPEKAVELRIAAENKNPNVASWVGEYYALAALGVTGLNLQRGLPASATDKMPETPFAQRARSTLTSTNDASLLMVGLATVTIAGKSLAKAGHLPAGYAEFCDALLNKAKQLQPAITTSCDTTGPVPENNALTRIRVGSDMQAASLIRKVQPAYPAEAKSRHIQGTVQFTAIIDKEGKIATLTLNEGALALYESARDAVRQWLYIPTLVDGRPVEVVTQIDVNFNLTR